MGPIFFMVLFIFLLVKNAIQFYLLYSKYDDMDQIIKKMTSFYLLTPYREKESGRKNVLKTIANFCYVMGIISWAAGCLIIFLLK